MQAFAGGGLVALGAVEPARFPRRLDGYPVSNMAGKSNSLMMA